MKRVIVTGDGAAVPQADLVLRPSGNFTSGIRQFQSEFRNPTSLEIDLLNVAAAIFCSDIAIKRGEREGIARQIGLAIPVVNLAAFNAIRDKLKYALYRLSYDAWEIQFTQGAGTPEPAQAWPATDTDRVLLFSGGLDSLAGAFHLAEGGDHVVLVSHVTANQAVSGAQDSLFEYLCGAYPDQFRRLAFRVSGRRTATLTFPSDQDREETQRTRSFLFLALAALVARRRGVHDVVVIAENGQMAIHLPLSAGRIGAFSTHTAHPEFVNTAADLLTTLLQHDVRIENPFLYKTKAEVVASTVRQHRATLGDAISCWKASRVGGGLNHCGFCVPCLVRRVAVEANGAAVAEYQRDLLRENVGALPPDDDGKRNLVEFCEFTRHFSGNATQAELELIFPDLINAHFDPGQVVAMYRRFAAEAVAVFANYPQVAALLR